MSNINTVQFRGPKNLMGFEYGKIMRDAMLKSLSIIKDFFIIDNKVSFDELVEHANKFYQRCPESYKIFIDNIPHGSGMTLDEVKILNGMETLNDLLGQNQTLGCCSLIAIPSNRSSTSSTLIGRNYDFPSPFDEIAQYLSVVTLDDTDAKTKTTIITLPGQIYCPSGLNDRGIFAEINNAMPSGGYSVNDNRESLLVNLLIALQSSTTFRSMDKMLMSFDSDYSLIVNVMEKNNIKSYEFSSIHGMKTYTPAKGEIFVSTNFYLNQSWGVGIPKDEHSWLSVSRRKNLLKFQKDYFDIKDVMQILDTDLTQGGATWNGTIYQIAFDTSSKVLHIKRTKSDNDWVVVPI